MGKLIEWGTRMVCKHLNENHNWIDLSLFHRVFREYGNGMSPFRCSKAIVNLSIIYNNYFIDMYGWINFWMQIDLGKDMVEESFESLNYDGVE